MDAIKLWLADVAAIMEMAAHNSSLEPWLIELVGHSPVIAVLVWMYHRMEKLLNEEVKTLRLRLSEQTERHSREMAEERRMCDERMHRMHDQVNDILARLSGKN